MESASDTQDYMAQAHAPFQTRRLQQLLCAVLIATCVVCATLLGGRQWEPGLIVAATATVLLRAFFKVRKGQTEQAASLMLITLTASFCYLIFRGQGLRDEAILALPGILIFASMFGSRKLYLGLFAMMCCVLTIVGLSHFLGWRSAPITRVRLDTYVTLISILSVIGYYIWLMATDLRNTMASLQTENKRVRKSLAQIEILAHHDALTGLPNRVLARDRFDHASSQALRSQTRAALLFLDLDNFKTVNDSLGHAAGDALLCDVATRLLGTVRANDTVSRQGGDEFLIVLGDLADEDAVAAIAVKLVAQLANPFQINGLEVTATCSLGIAMFPGNGTDFDSLLKHADMAMYQAKDSGRNAFRFFDEAMNKNVAEHLHLISAMRTALANGEFKLHYQPQFSLKDQRVVGAEALLRWTHPELGSISPARFIPLAERSGLIVDIGSWVLHEACRQAKAWQLAGLKDLVVAINISPVQFRREGIERDILNALAEADLSPLCIELELTESLLIAEATHLSELLRRLRAMGLRFSIDDFGTGYSNLGYLKRFDVERLKIDQSFVRRMTVDANDEGIVRAIVQMSHSLKLDAVAEGIEDAQALASLVEMGCDYGQGFHWAPALPPDEFLRFAQNRHLVAG
jgi:diguanylate cyclase (GGDEF)-like protein